MVVTSFLFLSQVSTSASGTTGFIIDTIQYLANPSLHNIAGDKINTIETGQQSFVRVSIHNGYLGEQSLVILVEVRDDNGVTKEIFWQTTTIRGGGNYTMETSWTPTEEGINYQIRSFVLTDFENPEVLSPVYSLDEITITESPYYIPPHIRHFTVTMDENKFDIEYIIDSGQVRQIVVDVETGSLTMMLAGVRKDSNFTVKLPAELIHKLFSLEQAEQLLRGNQDALPAIFVDEEIAFGKITEFSVEEYVSLTILLKEGSENVELVKSFSIGGA
jgi:hypothetical protein